MLKLYRTQHTDRELRYDMAEHYSKPKGFVGRSICYAVFHGDVRYGSMVGGSSVRHLPGRTEFFGSDEFQRVINNTFFHIQGPYPTRNFAQKVVRLWRETIQTDWLNKYGDHILGFETLVEPPRTGDVYLRDGWHLGGETKGFTCKRTSGTGTDSWGGSRQWDKENLRPKLVFYRKTDMELAPLPEMQRQFLFIQ